jgi:deoxyribonuclease-4
MNYIGSHISLHNFINFDNPYIESAKYLNKYYGNIFGIMLNLGNKKLTDKKILTDCKKYIRKHDIKIVVHSSYIYNIAQDWDQYSSWILSLKQEIKCAYKMGAFCVIIHFGKHKLLNKNIAYNNMFTSLVYIHNATFKYKKVKILLETTAGQGTEMCYLFDDLVYFYNKFKKSHNSDLRKRIKLCVDTCHIFAAGYDISSKDKILQYFNNFNKYIGIKNIKLIHLNDSKGGLGSKLDRHQELGKGHIGKENLLLISKICTNNNIPIIVETPNNAFKKEIPLILNYIKK